MWQVIYRREKNTNGADYLLKRKPLLLEKTFPALARVGLYRVHLIA
jgi:hypothetical protein